MQSHWCVDSSLRGLRDSPPPPEFLVYRDIENYHK